MKHLENHTKQGYNECKKNPVENFTDYGLS